MRVAMTDVEAAEMYGRGWRSPDTIPSDKDVTILTMGGDMRVGRRPGRVWIKRADKHGPRRVQVISGRGRIYAVAWSDGH